MTSSEPAPPIGKGKQASLLQRWAAKIEFWLYRARTIVYAVWCLWFLPEEKVNAFVNSYMVFNLDWKDEAGMIEKFGEHYYAGVKQKLVDYYSVLNYLCSIGDVEKMYIPPAIDLSKGIIANQNLFEEMMARDLGLNASSTVLDIGCGRGRVAAHMCRYADANVVGINIDSVQIESAERFAMASGLSHKCHYFHGDVNDIPFRFADGSFDHIYHVQVFSYSRDLERLFRELFRLLKPGGRFACLDYVLLDGYDGTNAEHRELLDKVKPLLGAIGSPTVEEYAGGLERAGFKILENRDASPGGHQHPLIDAAHTWYITAGTWIHRLARWRILPRHFPVLFDRLSKYGDDFVEADKRGMLTTSWYIVAEKPVQ